MNKLDMLRDFQRIYGSNVGKQPAFPSTAERKLRKDLLDEEFKEYLEGEENDNFIEVCDALADMLYIIYGTCVSYGIPIDDIFQEVHNSNLSKLGDDGKPIYRDDGKILKGPNYFKPNIEDIVNRHNVK